MSKHNIHGIEVNIEVSQGNLSDAARGRCVGRLVNLCRELPESEFISAMNDLKADRFGGQHSATLLRKLDAALAAGYTSRFTDDLAPIASISIA